MQIGQTASTHCPLMFLIFKQHLSHLTILPEPVARPTLTLTTLGPVECGFLLNLEWDERKKRQNFSLNFTIYFERRTSLRVVKSISQNVLRAKVEKS